MADFVFEVIGGILELFVDIFFAGGSKRRKKRKKAKEAKAKKSRWYWYE